MASKKVKVESELDRGGKMISETKQETEVIRIIEDSEEPWGGGRLCRGGATVSCEDQGLPDGLDKGAMWADSHFTRATLPLVGSLEGQG